MAKELTQKELESYLFEIREFNDWRNRADLCVAYYDGRQLTPQQQEDYKQRGFAPLIRNYIRPTVDLVLGMEAKNRRDWKVSADREQDIRVAEALSFKLKGAERASRADRACSDAYGSMVKSGIGWVEVVREQDPVRGPYRCSSVHRNEIAFDPRAKEPDLSDARYLIREQWLDIDTIKAWFPKKAKVIDGLRVNEDSFWQGILQDYDRLGNIDNAIVNAYESVQVSSLDSTSWRGSDAEWKRLRLSEVWYRIWEEGLLMKTPSGDVIEYDKNNFKHLLLAGSPGVVLSKQWFTRVRLSWWIGPVKLSDEISPYPHSHFPYVAFIAGRDNDGVGMPKSMVADMISPQDEINARLSRMMWLLSAKRIIADTDAVDRPWNEVAEEAARANAVIHLNPHRTNKNADAFRVESDFALSQQQFMVLQDATKAIQDVAGVYQAQLGKESSAESGIAINSLVEQGSTTLAEMNDNYRHARTLVGEILLSLVREDLADEAALVEFHRDGTYRRITLNEVVQDDNGHIRVLNSVSLARLTVALEDIPSTPSYRQQQLTMMTEIVKSLPPEVMPLFADFMVKSTDLPDRDELVQRIRKMFGYGKPMDEMTPEEQAALEQQSAMEQQAQQLALQQQQAVVEKLLAEVEKLRAEVDKLQVETDLAADQAALEAVSVERDQNQKRENALLDEDIKQRAAEQKFIHTEMTNQQKIAHAEMMNKQKLQQAQQAKKQRESKPNRANRSAT